MLLVMVIYDPLFRRLFELRPLRFMGRVSYGFYLWHLPVLAIVSGLWNPSPHSSAGLLKTAVVFSVSLTIGWVVHVWIERRFGPWISQSIKSMGTKLNVAKD